jgi:hypothetical protein
MNGILVLLQIFENFVLQSPFKEIELPHSGVQPLEVNVLPTTEGVEHTLGIGLQVGLLGKLHNYLASVGSVLGNILLLGLIRDQPVQKTERNTRLARQDHTDTFEVCRIRLKALQAVKDPLFFGLDGLH